VVHKPVHDSVIASRRDGLFGRDDARRGIELRVVVAVAFGALLRLRVAVDLVGR
jgi:hypothetical protein